MYKRQVNTNGQVRLEYSIPARGLIGFRTEFLTDTRGYGVMNHSFESYKVSRGESGGRKNGVLIAVSYTHLDVYKRQFSGTSSGFCFTAAL